VPTARSIHPAGKPLDNRNLFIFLRFWRGWATLFIQQLRTAA